MPDAKIVLAKILAKTPLKSMLRRGSNVLIIAMLIGKISCTQKMESFDDCVLQKIQPGMDRVAVAVVMKACRDKFSSSSLPPSAVRNLSGSLASTKILLLEQFSMAMRIGL